MYMNVYSNMVYSSKNLEKVQVINQSQMNSYINVVYLLNRILLDTTCNESEVCGCLSHT